MKKGLISFLIASVYPALMFGQSAAVNDCNEVKYGTFYFYPENTQGKFAIIREIDIQTEINLSTSDTTFWKIKWINACEFNLSFIRKSRPISVNEKTFYDSHTNIVKIEKVMKTYYTFKAGLDSINNTVALADTLWLKARIK